jgi:uncharacterized phage-associated protein
MVRFHSGHVPWAGMERAMSIDDVCDYIIARCAEAEVGLNVLKLQKLLYYVQAWHLAFFGKPLFEGHFQAWVHGPVNREIYDRFKDEKSLYSSVTSDDIRRDFNSDDIKAKAQRHINKIVSVYGNLTGRAVQFCSSNAWDRAKRVLTGVEAA